MGITRSDLFTETQNELANVAKALGHPARLAILEHLIKANACINSDLVEETGLAQATVSQHLRALKDIGLVQGTIEGTRMNYCINAQRWQELKNTFNQLFERYPNPAEADCC